MISVKPKQVSMVLNGFAALPRPNVVTAIIACAFTFCFVAALCVLFEPAWETNDDVAMSMVAHGYGIAAYGTPTLVFSNVVWGAIVRSLPAIDGLLGYSVATLGCLVLSGSTIIYALQRIGAGLLVSGLVMVLILSRAVLFPQFTINAGLLTIAAVTSILAYDRTRSLPLLAVGCLLGVFGFLVRNLEFALVLIVALPILPWRLVRQRQALVAMAVVFLAILGATTADYLSFTGRSWDYFWELNWPRAMFTDFGAGPAVLARPDIMARHGLSANDVDLVSNWFFVDKQLANPTLLKTVLDEISFKVGSSFDLKSGLAALQNCLVPPMLPVVATAFGLILLTSNLRCLASLGMCVLLIFTLGTLGRSAVLRVFIPPILLLVVVACAQRRLHVPWRRIVGIVVLLATVAWNARFLADEVKTSQAIVTSAQQTKFGSSDVTVVWGGALPFQYIFPVKTRKTEILDTRISGLGTFTYAPFSVGYQEENSDGAFLLRLRRPAGVPLVASPLFLTLLDSYCREHFGVPLSTAERQKTPAWTVLTAKCNSGVN